MSAAAADAAPKNERLNINISSRTASALRRLSETRESTVTETVRRAIAVLDFIEDEVDSGGTIQVHYPDGTVKQLALV